MSYHGSNAGPDEARSVSHRSRRDDHEYAPLPHHKDRDNGSIAHYSTKIRNVGDDSISTTSVRVRTKNNGPPISYNNRYGNDERLSSNRRSGSRSGSIRAPSVAFDGAARPPSHRSGSISRGGDRSDSPERYRPPSHRSGSISRGGDESPERHRPLQRKTGSHSGSKRAPSVSSDRTARPSKPRDRERDTDSQAIDTQSYTSGQQPKIMVPEEGRGSLYEEDWKAGRSVYLREKPRGRIAPSEASDRTLKSAREMASLSEDTESLSLDPRDPPDVRVAKWNEKVKRDTNPTIGPRSVSSRDHYGEGSNAPSHQEYQESLRSERPSHTSRSRQPYVAPSRTSRNPPPPPRRGTYVERADYSQMYVTHETHETHIHAPDLSFMNEPRFSGIGVRGERESESGNGNWEE
ncbi:hypothetical protein BTUL_0022g00730 [Botrytis tulipae]|uniref:Uncharacterized protein n=1 Tax=Botrytis tulipae TaxID=87230 RepID=A0A4Z1F675_9HELO|nr:hypothetical protein BTUL_0022g00730 [Botrytis tulipae]